MISGKVCLFPRSTSTNAPGFEQRREKITLTICASSGGSDQLALSTQPGTVVILNIDQLTVFTLNFERVHYESCLEFLWDH